MPFGLIIQILAALVLLSSAPEGAQPPLSLPWLALAWCAKLLLWYWFCAFLFNKASSSSARNRLVDTLQWIALIPLISDFYLLRLGFILKVLLPYEWSAPVRELMKLAFLLIYWMAVWASFWHMEKQDKAGGMHPLREEVSQRIRMVAPILLPFIFLNLLEGLLRAVPSPRLQEFLSTPWAEALFFIFFALLVLVFIPPMIIRLWKCVELPHGTLREFLERSLREQNVSFASIYIWPLHGGKACTAAVLGIFPKWRYILFTPCLLHHLSPEEIEAVLAHEIAHVRHRHLVWYVVFLALYSFVLYNLLDPLWTWCLSRPQFVDFLLGAEGYLGDDQTFLLALPIGLSMLLYFRFVMGYFMRHFERQADLGAVNVQGHPYYLISALEKISILAGGIRNKPSWHHFSIAERVDFLKSAGAHPEVRHRFERGLALKRSVFLVLCMGLAILPKAMPVKSWQKSARINLAEVYLQELLKNEKHDPRWYMAIGQILYEKGDYKRALTLLKKAEALAPGNPEIMNSIAWLYATARDPSYRDPAAALMYASGAAKIRPAPHILDTLAESLFLNGYVEEAVRIEEEALRKAERNRAYYKAQLERFRKCLSEGDCSSYDSPAG